MPPKKAAPVRPKVGPKKAAPVRPKVGPGGFTGKDSAKHTVTDLRRKASAIKRQHCPATSKMKRKELIAYIEKHQ